MQVERENLRIIACPHILSVEKGRIDVQRPAGGTVNDLIRSIGWTPDSLSARVFIDGEYVKDAAWEYTVPGPGQSVVVRAIPMGGGGGGGNQGKDAGRMVAMIAIMVAAIAAQQYWAVGLAAATGMSALASSAVIVGSISLAGSLAVTAKIPQGLPRLCDQREVRHG